MEGADHGLILHMLGRYLYEGTEENYKSIIQKRRLLSDGLTLLSPELLECDCVMLVAESRNVFFDRPVHLACKRLRVTTRIGDIWQLKITVTDLICLQENYLSVGRQTGRGYKCSVSIWEIVGRFNITSHFFRLFVRRPSE